MIIALVASQAMGQSKPKVWKSTAEPLQEIEMLRQQIKLPIIPKTEFPITNYGAIGDGKTLNTQAFKNAIEDCNKKGGGKVLCRLVNS